MMYREAPNEPNQRAILSGAVRAALFIALITVGSYVVVPLPFSPVPVALQSGFVILAGLLLPLRWAVISVGSYLLLGALGLPLFAGGSGGLAHLVGPTGGYLVGFLPAVAVTAMIARDNLFLRAAAALAGTLIVYGVGVPWLALRLAVGAVEAISLGLLPFLPGDAVKIVAATALAEGSRSLLPEELRRA